MLIILLGYIIDILILYFHYLQFKTTEYQHNEAVTILADSRKEMSDSNQKTLMTSAVTAATTELYSSHHGPPLPESKLMPSGVTSEKVHIYYIRYM